MVRVNDYWATTSTGQRTAVLNGQTGSLVDATGTGLVVRMDHDDAGVVLPHAVVAAGGVDYAYASTVHRAQGGTWDVAITVGLDGLYREAGYVVLSRGKAANWLVVTAPDLAEVDAELARHDSPIPLPGEEPGDLDEELVGAFSTSRHKLLALAQDPAAPAVHHAATTTDLPALEARARLRCLRWSCGRPGSVRLSASSASTRGGEGEGTGALDACHSGPVLANKAPRLARRGSLR